MVELKDIQFFELRVNRTRKVNLSFIYDNKEKKAKEFEQKVRNIKEVSERINQKLQSL